MSVHITALEAEGFKRLKAVTLKPTAKGLTVIGGKNGAGKTSVLDAIVFALGGDKYRPSEPQNRESTNPPVIKIVMSNGLIVERKGKNSSLKITDPNGLKGGQGVLDKFVEKLALDLPKFMQSTSKEKAQTLLKIIGAGDKLAELDAKEKTAFDDRRDADKEAVTAEKQLEGMEYFDDAPDDLILVTELLAKIEEAEAIRRQEESLERQCQDKIRLRSGAETRLQDLQTEIENTSDLYEQEVEDLKARHDLRIEDLGEEKVRSSKNVNTWEAERVELAKQIKAINVPDVEPLKSKAAGAEEVNARVRANVAYAEKKTEAKYRRKQHAELESDIAKVRSDREKLLAASSMPIAGLTVVDGELVYKDMKWDGMSASEQLMVATSIVKELNPECGFVLVDKLEQMDVDTMNKFGEWAKEKGLQIIATRVSVGDECCVVIEDGSIAGENS